jgi:beta-lactamase regulating signal transducer with metallopeptidase domain
MSILQMSVSAGVLVIAIVLIRAVALNRLPKKMFLVLWGVALFRLLVPISIPLPFSVPNILVSYDGVSRTVLSDNSISPVYDNPVNAGEVVKWTTETSGQIERVAQGLIPNIAPTTVIWFVGMLVAFVFFAFLHYKNHRRLRFATAIRDNDYLNDWLMGHKHIRPIAIMQSDRIISPLAVGIFKPRIILPKSMNMSDKQLLDYVLSHEYNHIKRYDALWKILLLLALCVHWFNPMVWVMFILASRDLELTCDEMVIRRFGTKTKTAYAYILIGMVEHGSGFAPLYSGFSKNATQERIESIMKNKKLTLASVILAVVLVSTLTIGVLAASASEQSANDEPKSSMADSFLGNGESLKSFIAVCDESLESFIVENWDWIKDSPEIQNLLTKEDGFEVITEVTVNNDDKSVTTSITKLAISFADDSIDDGH